MPFILEKRIAKKFARDGVLQRLKPLQNLIFLIVVKNKFLKFQLVIFLKFVNLGVLQRFQASDQERKSGHEIYHTMNREKFYFLIKTILIC